MTSSPSQRPGKKTKTQRNKDTEGERHKDNTDTRERDRRLNLQKDTNLDPNIWNEATTIRGETERGPRVADGPVQREERMRRRDYAERERGR